MKSFLNVKLNKHEMGCGEKCRKDITYVQDLTNGVESNSKHHAESDWRTE